MKRTAQSMSIHRVTSPLSGVCFSSRRFVSERPAASKLEWLPGLLWNNMTGVISSLPCPPKVLTIQSRQWYSTRSHRDQYRWCKRAYNWQRALKTCPLKVLTALRSQVWAMYVQHIHQAGARTTRAVDAGVYITLPSLEVDVI